MCDLRFHTHFWLGIFVTFGLPRNAISYVIRLTFIKKRGLGIGEKIHEISHLAEHKVAKIKLGLIFTFNE